MRQIETIRIDSAPVQGPGSYVEARLPKWGMFRNALNLQDAQAIPYMTELLATTIVEWNWTDDHGEPLPDPEDDPSVIDNLTVAEVRFLVDAISSSGLDLKN